MAVGEATTVASAEFFEATLGSPFGEALHKARVGEESPFEDPVAISDSECSRSCKSMPNNGIRDMQTR